MFSVAVVCCTVHGSLLLCVAIVPWRQWSPTLLSSTISSVIWLPLSCQGSTRHSSGWVSRRKASGRRHPRPVFGTSTREGQAKVTTVCNQQRSGQNYHILMPG